MRVLRYLPRALESTGPAAACGIYKPSGRSLLIYRRLIPNTSGGLEGARARTSFGSRRVRLQIGGDADDARRSVGRPWRPWRWRWRRRWRPEGMRSAARARRRRRKSEKISSKRYGGACAPQRRRWWRRRRPPPASTRPAAETSGPDQQQRGRRNGATRRT